MTISNKHFEEVRRRLQTRRAGNDERGRRGVPSSAVRCTGCGARLVAVRTALGKGYYRCRRAKLGNVRDAACRAVVRVPD